MSIFWNGAQLRSKSVLMSERTNYECMSSKRMCFLFFFIWANYISPEGVDALARALPLTNIHDLDLESTIKFSFY